MRYTVNNECKYTPTHEWIKLSVENDVTIATCGITDYAQHQTGELVFIELPQPNTTVKAGDDVCVIESVKSASDIYTPISGKILEINEKLVETPNNINNSCYDDGWIFKIAIDNTNEVNSLLSSEEYTKKINV